MHGLFLAMQLTITHGMCILFHCTLLYNAFRCHHNKWHLNAPHTEQRHFPVFWQCTLTCIFQSALPQHTRGNGPLYVLVPIPQKISLCSPLGACTVFSLEFSELGYASSTCVKKKSTFIALEGTSTLGEIIHGLHIGMNRTSSKQAVPSQDIQLGCWVGHLKSKFTEHTVIL